MNNYANNTMVELGGKPYPELVIYWNFFQVDETVITNWVFFTYFDNVSFLGGFAVIILKVPIFVMLLYTFKLSEIDVFFYQ
jgi:hypothetical protein